MGGTSKYSATPKTTKTVFPILTPPSLPDPPPPPPIPTGSAIQPTGSVQPNPVINNALTNQINYSNMSIGYFKIDLLNTKSNLYGEAIEKWYYPPIEIKCLIERGATTNTDTEYGVDVTQTIKITVDKVVFESTYNFTPQVGDIVTDQDRFYEISSINRTFITLPGSGASNSTVGTPGQIVVFELDAYLTRTSKLNLIKYS
jgi:hypothetical protein